MSHRLYLVVTRSSVLLILALMFAPLWDFWRYGGSLPSAGAGFPVAVIMSAPRRQPAPIAEALPASTVAPAGQDDATPPPQVAAFRVASRGWEQASTGQYRPDFAAGSDAFEAWSARAQVDPFWDGDEARTPSTDSPAAADGAEAEPGGTDMPADAADDAYGDGAYDVKEGPDAGPEDAEDQTHWTEDTGGRRHHAEAADIQDGAHAPAADDGAAAGEAGLVPGYWPAPAAQDGQAPAPIPAPPDSGAPITGRVGAPRPSPGDPTPQAAAIPSIAVIPSNPEVVEGETFTVTVQIQNADQVTSLPFHLIFDPSVIEFLGSQPGGALAGHDPVLLASVSPSRPGDLAVGLSLIESAGTFTGTGEVVVLQFRALAPGRSDFSFSRATLRGASSEPVEARFSNGYVDVR